MKTVEDENTSEGIENLQAVHKKRLNRSMLLALVNTVVLAYVIYRIPSFSVMSLLDAVFLGSLYISLLFFIYGTYTNVKILKKLAAIKVLLMFKDEIYKSSEKAEKP